MILGHLSDLHLGFRAWGREGGGRNEREGDVAAAFERATEALVRLAPDVVLFSGDLFDRSDPPSAALVALGRGLATLRDGLPRTPLLVLAGARDTPRDEAEPVVLEMAAALPGVHVACEAVRSLDLPVAGATLHVRMLPFRALLRDPLAPVEPDSSAEWSVLAVHGRAEPHGAAAAGTVLDIDSARWSYVALGGEHRFRRAGERAWYAGALERVGREPWLDATEARGFVTVDLAEGRPRFHALPGRPVVALAPIRVPPHPEALRSRVREVTDEVPGGIEGKIVRLTLRDAPPDALLALQGEPMSRLRDAALHVVVEVEEDAVAPPAPAEVGALLKAALGSFGLHGGDGAPAAPSPADPPRGTVVAVLPTGAGDPRRDVAGLVEGEDVVAWAGGRGPDAALAAAARTVMRAWGGAALVARLPEEPGAGGDMVERAGRRAALEGAPDALRRHEEELRRLRADHAEVAGDLEEATMEWLRERQDAETQLQAYRDRARELKARLAELEGSGPEAPCPLCDRPLADHAEAVVAELREEWESLVQDGSWWRRRREQLELKPDTLQAVESRNVRLQAEMEDQAERVERARSRVRELDELRGAGAVEEGAAAALAGLEAAAGRWVVGRASLLVGRVTGGRLLALGQGEGGAVRIEGWARRLARPSLEDGAAAALALHLAGARCAAEAGAPPATLVLAEALDALSVPDRERAVGLLRDAAARIGRVVAVMGPDLLDRRPEAFDAVLRVGPGGEVTAEPAPATLRVR